MTLRVAMAQINSVVGDLEGNVERILARVAEAEAAGCDLALFPELAVTGYPPEDLVLKPQFVADNRAALDEIAARTGSCAVIVGFVDQVGDGSDPVTDSQRGGAVANAAALCAGGELVGVYRKRLLPNYAVFDEERYFTPGTGPAVFPVAGTAVGLSICEDAWRAGGPLVELVQSGADVVVNLSASPYHRGRLAEREAMLFSRALELDTPILYCNLVGGQDELVFDGGSIAVDSGGGVQARAPLFEEALVIVDVEGGGAPAGTVRAISEPALAPTLDSEAETYGALVLGTRDYVHKNGFTDVVLGLSGGIDSALVACIATDALGPDHVHTVALPSRYSSRHSLDDAAALAANLGVDHRVIPIEPAHAAFTGMLGPSFSGREPGVTDENVQARSRAVVLKALENELGWLLLATGNKSEVATGFGTLYGDMAGGFNPVKDLFKTLLYRLARWRNRQAEAAGAVPPLPESILTKAPSAELRPDQRDDQSLPPYEVLDPLLEAYVEGDRTVTELIAAGHDEALVRRIAHLVEAAEHKRHQAPIGVRISQKAFGKDRRMPITNRYRG